MCPAVDWSDLQMTALELTPSFKCVYRKKIRFNSNDNDNNNNVWTRRILFTQYMFKTWSFDFIFPHCPKAGCKGALTFLFTSRKYLHGAKKTSACPFLSDPRGSPPATKNIRVIKFSPAVKVNQSGAFLPSSTSNKPGSAPEYPGVVWFLWDRAALKVSRW